MCGRFLLFSSPDLLRQAFGFAGAPNLPARYNIAPTQEVAIVRRAGDGLARELATARWGLVPSWARDAKVGYSTFNARGEGVAGKPAFREAFRRRRCLVPADGFYEWRKLDGGKVKQPFLIRRRDRAPFAFAGLWELWRGPDGPMTSATIVTTRANATMATLHDRQPVILAATDHDRWLDPARGGPPDLLGPCPDDWLELTPVSARINNARNEGAELLEGALDPP